MQRAAEEARFEVNEPRLDEGVSPGYLETILSRAEHVSALAASLTSDSAWQEWERLPRVAQEAESELRNAIARRFERVANGERAGETDAHLSLAFTRWTETIQRLSLEGSRIAFVSQIAAEARRLG